jgi:hypothetical protein
MNSKYVKTVTVIDPDTKGEVEIEIRKLANGGMVGLDASFLSQTDDEIYSPYDRDTVMNLPDHV